MLGHVQGPPWPLHGSNGDVCSGTRRRQVVDAWWLRARGEEEEEKRESGLRVFYARKSSPVTLSFFLFFCLITTIARFLVPNAILFSLSSG